MVAGRNGLRRLWGLADFPVAEELPDAEAVTRAAEHSLRALGVARARDVERHFTMGRYPGLDLERAGWARPVRVEGGTEQWWVHRDVLARLDEDWRPRITLLLAVRQPHLRPGPDRTAVGLRLPQRDVRAQGQAAVRLLRDAGAVRGAADRPGRPADGPQERAYSSWRACSPSPGRRPIQRCRRRSSRWPSFAGVASVSYAGPVAFGVS